MTLCFQFSVVISCSSVGSSPLMSNRVTALLYVVDIRDKQESVIVHSVYCFRATGKLNLNAFLI